MAKDRDARPVFEEVAPQLARIARRLGAALPRVTRAPFPVPAEVSRTQSAVASPGATSASHTAATISSAAIAPASNRPRVLLAIALLVVGVIVAALVVSAP
jgi:hypothetical protein